MTLESLTAPAPAAERAPALWTVEEPDPAAGGGELPIVATAIHAGHALDPQIAGAIALSDDERLREEDPGTERFTEIGVTRVIVRRSRFEVDLNRPRDGAVYATPEAAWGLRVWKAGGAPREALALGRREHDEFYAAMETLLAGFAARFGRFAVYDVHSYNHRRNGSDAPPEDEAENPEINLGTGALGTGALGAGGRERWAPVVDRFAAELRAHGLDVRENVKFQGGHFPRWVAQRFPESACPLAIEVKKVYMDEWTGRIDDREVRRIRKAFAATLPGVAQALAEVADVAEATEGGGR